MTLRHDDRLLTAVLLLAYSGAGLAQDAGTVTFATGSVAAERETAVPLAVGDTVLVEDTIVTGGASRAQLLMIDNAKFAIRPDSRVRLAEYFYSGEAAAPAAAVTTSGDNSSVLNLVKGGFRTITGAIGDEDPADYEVRTAVGVLGIRGTDFALLFCNGDCDTAPGVTPGATVANGLYIMVTDGDIFFTNEVATLELTAGDFAFIPLDTRLPTPLATPPAVFIDTSDFQIDDPAAQAPPDDDTPEGFDSALGTRRTPDAAAPGSSAFDPEGASQSDEAGRETPEQSIQGIDLDGSPVDLTPGGPPDRQNRTIGYSTGPLPGQLPQWGAVLDNAPTEYRLDGGNNVERFAGLYPSRTGVNTVSLDVGSAGHADAGFDSMTVLRWGRWSGGVATATFTDGSTENIDLGNQGLHWIASPEWLDPPSLPIGGQANYALLGGTLPTDNLGNVGVLGNATFVADFTNMSVMSTLDIMINGSNWLAQGQGGIGAAADPVLPAHLFNGTYGAITIDGVTGGFGQFSGFFSAPGPSSDPAFPGGVGMTYSLQDMNGTTTVSGAAAFGNP